MRVLAAWLLEHELEKQARSRRSSRASTSRAGCGNQIRSYVLHPYKMVKDHRTGYETSDPNAVLDGDLDGFIQAYLKSTIGA